MTISSQLDLYSPPLVTDCQTTDLYPYEIAAGSSLEREETGHGIRPRNSVDVGPPVEAFSAVSSVGQLDRGTSTNLRRTPLLELRLAGELQTEGSQDTLRFSAPQVSGEQVPPAAVVVGGEYVEELLT